MLRAVYDSTSSGIPSLSESDATARLDATNRAAPTTANVRNAQGAHAIRATEGSIQKTL